MMLILKIQDFKEHSFFDVNLEFTKLKIEPSLKNKKIVTDIEHGTLIDSFTFIDRFGYKQRLNNMSTGCKAVLCMINSENFVNFIECGENVINYVINYCNEGKMVLFDRNIRFEKYTSNIDVLLDGYRFKTIERLNYYLNNEEFGRPNLNVEGVEAYSI